MSAAKVSFHSVTDVSLSATRAGNTTWVTINATDATGGSVEVTLFTDTPEALLAQLVGKRVSVRDHDREVADRRAQAVRETVEG